MKYMLCWSISPETTMLRLMHSWNAERRCLKVSHLWVVGMQQAPLVVGYCAKLKIPWRMPLLDVVMSTGALGIFLRSVGGVARYLS